MGDLLNEITFNYDNLMNICPSIFTSQQDGGVLTRQDISFNFTDSDTIISNQKKYYDKVEEGNRYLEELQEIEEEYFKSKYGEKIYNHIIEKRDTYIGQKTNTTEGDVTKLTDYHEIYNDISNLDLSDYKQLKKNMKNIENDVTKMMNETETNKRKVEYRHDVALKVQVQTQKATYIYYFILICIFILLFSRNALNIKKNMVLYSILIIFPLIYRYIFIGLVYLYNMIEHHFNRHGPKNAFINNATDIQFLDDFDI